MTYYDEEARARQAMVHLSEDAGVAIDPRFVVRLIPYYDPSVETDVLHWRVFMDYHSEKYFLWEETNV